MTEDERKQAQLKKFREDLTRIRNQERKRKGLAPLTAFDGQPSPPAVVLSVVPPPPPDPPVSREHEDWQRTMTSLTRLEPIFLWGEEQREGTWRLFCRLEHECVTAAENQPDEYQRLKKAYLTAVGNLCELYFVGHTHGEVIDILSFGLGMKEICLHGNTPPAEEILDAARVHFFAREIPLLCCATPSELQDLMTVKEVMPGARII